MYFKKLDIKYSKFRFHDLVQEVFTMCRFQMGGKDIKLETNIDFKESIEIESDRKRIKQILTNMIINAI